MKQPRFLRIGVSIAILSILLLGVSVLFDTNHQGLFCPKAANAQDNPCLAQDATISAQEVKILHLQNTIVALQSGSQNNATNSSSGGSNSSSSLPFGEDFSSNQNGWYLGANDFGASRISQGRLLITAAEERGIIIPIPNFVIPDEFYFEVDIYPVTTWSMQVGLALGSTENDDWHTFIAGKVGQCCGSGKPWTIAFQDHGENIFSTEYPILWEAGGKITIGLESSGGQYTLYINGRATESINLIPYGQELGLVVIAYEDWASDADTSAAFDNISIRDSR